MRSIGTRCDDSGLWRRRRESPAGCRVHGGFVARLLMSVAFLLLVAPARADADAPLRATLGNGLQVVIVRNSLAPVVSTAVNYLVGSDEAPAGFPGTAHAQEHMMFRGSPGLSADQLADIGSLMGGEFNANTREDLTQYLFTVPAEDLDVALHIEAVRMRAVMDSKQAWDQERGAIEQEVAQDQSNPTYVLYQRLRATLFAGTPYAHDALGTRPSFDHTSAAMLRHFHDAWYAPNNAILVVVGDVDPRATLEKIQTVFGSIPRKRLPARPDFKPGRAHSMDLHIDTDQPTGTALLAMRLPGLDSRDFPALELLADVLSSHRFDLYALVPQGRAVDAQFALDPLPRASLGYAEVSFATGADPATLEAAIRGVLEKVVREGVPAELVQAAKLQERRQAQFQKNSIPDLASVWSDALALYGLHSPDDDLARIEKLTVADVNRVARKYFDLNNAVWAVAKPHGTGRPVVSGGAPYGGQETIALGQTPPSQLPDWAIGALTHVAAPSSLSAPVVSTLANGLTLIVQPEDISDTVSVFGHVRNRPELEAGAQQQGVSDVLEQMFHYGTVDLDRLNFARALDAIGAEERAGVDFGVQVLAHDFDHGVALLAANELHPALPPAALGTVANQLAQVLTARDHSPAYLTQRSLRAALFPADDPTLREASAQTVRSLTPEDVRAYYRRVFRPDVTCIVVIGKISPTEARAAIENYFGSWKAEGTKPDTDLPGAPPNGASAIAVADSSRVQDNVILGQDLALTRSDPDYYALELGSTVLGGGFYSTRLSIDLRKNLGLVYSVASTLQAGRTRGVYLIHFACDPGTVTRATQAVVKELRNMQAAAPSADELLRAKALLVRNRALRESSVAEIGNGLIQRWDLGLPLDEPTIAARKYLALTGSDVQQAFQHWIRPDDLVRIIQGPAPK